RLPIRRDLQDRRTAQAAMSEKNILVKLRVVAAHVGFEGDAAQIPKPEAFLAIQRQRRQGGPGFSHSQTELPRDSVAEIGCTDLRNGESARCNGERLAVQIADRCG